MVKKRWNRTFTNDKTSLLAPSFLCYYIFVIGPVACAWLASWTGGWALDSMSNDKIAFCYVTTALGVCRGRIMAWSAPQNYKKEWSFLFCVWGMWQHGVQGVLARDG